MKEQAVLIADGAWGTELMREGVAPGECPEKLNLEKPGIICKIAKSYIDAGADIILTNTFGGSRFKLRRAGLDDKVREINRLGVEISRQAAGGSYVFASLGPTGEFIQPLGAVSKEEMVSCFREQAEGFIEGGADGVVIETMSDMEEAECALSAVRQISRTLPVAVTFTFQKGAKGFATVMGLTPRQMAEQLQGRVDLLGANCGSGIDEFIDIASELKELTDTYLWMKPNAGSPVLEDGKVVYRETPAEMAETALALASLGVKVLGGCCGTTSEHIKQFCSVIRGRR